MVRCCFGKVLSRNLIVFARNRCDLILQYKYDSGSLLPPHTRAQTGAAGHLPSAAAPAPRGQAGRSRSPVVADITRVFAVCWQIYMMADYAVLLQVWTNWSHSLSSSYNSQLNWLLGITSQNIPPHCSDLSRMCGAHDNLCPLELAPPWLALPVPPQPRHRQVGQPPLLRQAHTQVELCQLLWQSRLAVWQFIWQVNLSEKPPQFKTRKHSITSNLNKSSLICRECEYCRMSLEVTWCGAMLRTYWYCPPFLCNSSSYSR